MIQRKQTLWLLLSLICAALTFRLPFYHGTVHTEAVGVSGAELTATDNIWLILLAGSTVAIAILAIAMFKDRTLQFRLTLIGLLLSVGLIVAFYIYAQKFATGGIALTSLINVGIIGGFFFALKGIRNDQKLIRDLNRLR